MASLRGRFLFNRGDFEHAFESKTQLILDAAFTSMKEVATTVKLEARANIAAAGMSTRWQNALRVDVFGPGKTLRPDEIAAVWVFHKIPYSGIFERGGTITPHNPSGLLWIPTSFAPKKGPGGHRLTPQNFPGKLFPVTSKSGRKLLMARVAKGGSSRRLTLKGIDRDRKRLKGGERGVSARTLPIFTGLSTHTIRKRFAIMQIVRKARAQLAEAFAHNLKE